MKTLFFFIFLSSSIAFSQEIYEGMAEESLLLKASTDQDAKAILPCKAYVSIGKSLSRIRIKKTEIPGIVITKNDPQIFVRGKSTNPSVPGCLIKLNDKGKTLQAFYSDDLGKKFQVIPTTLKAANRDLKIYQVSLLNPLEDGYYAFFFNRRTQDGNFQLGGSGKLTFKPMVFQVVSE